MSDQIQLRKVQLQNENNGSLKDIFANIDYNFNALLSSDYAQGEKGDGFTVVDEPLVEDGYLTDLGKKFADVMIKDVYSKDWQEIGTNDCSVEKFRSALNKALSPKIDDNVAVGVDDLVNWYTTTSISCVVSDSDYSDGENNTIVMSGMFYFTDLRLAVINTIEDATGFADLSGIFWVTPDEEKGFVVNKSNNLPKLEYKDKTFKWVYGNSLNVNAVGVAGKDGLGGQLYTMAGHISTYEGKNVIEVIAYYNTGTKQWTNIANLGQTPEGSMALAYETDNTDITSWNTEAPVFTNIWIGGTIYDSNAIYVDASHNGDFKTMAALTNHTAIFNAIGKGSSALDSYMPYLYWPSSKNTAGDNPIDAGCFKFVEDNYKNTDVKTRSLLFTNTANSAKNLKLPVYDANTNSGWLLLDLLGHQFAKDNIILNGDVNMQDHNLTVANIVNDGSITINGQQNSLDSKCVPTKATVDAMIEAKFESLTKNLASSICPIGTIMACSTLNWHDDMKPLGSLSGNTCYQDISGLIWAECDGKTYTANGSNITTPNLAVKSLIGQGTSKTSWKATTADEQIVKVSNGYSTGETLTGTESVALTMYEMPAHQHTVSGGKQKRDYNKHGEQTMTSLTGTSETGSTSWVGGMINGQASATKAHNNMPPFYVVSFRIRIA